jgi:hypothetical protein
MFFKKSYKYKCILHFRKDKYVNMHIISSHIHSLLLKENVYPIRDIKFCTTYTYTT